MMKRVVGLVLRGPGRRLLTITPGYENVQVFCSRDDLVFNPTGACFDLDRSSEQRPCSSQQRKGRLRRCVAQLLDRGWMPPSQQPMTSTASDRLLRDVQDRDLGISRQEGSRCFNREMVKFSLTPRKNGAICEVCVAISIPVWQGWALGRDRLRISGGASP